MGTRSTVIGQGLAPVESGVGTMISFSTQPGNVALDGADRNSPFARALVKYVSTSNESLADILIGVRNQVIKETDNKQVPWEHSALTGRFYFNVGARPAAFSGITARGMFDRDRAKELRALAKKHALPLPDFQIEVPRGDVPANLRRFIGVWFAEPDFANDKRANMIIVTRVYKDGKLDGYWVYGPPVPGSRFQYPANLFRIAGTVTEQTLRFRSPSGKASFRFTLTSENKMDYVFSSTIGESSNKTFVPFWRLAEAERALKARGGRQQPTERKKGTPQSSRP
jgi:hypothetical protein